MRDLNFEQCFLPNQHLLGINDLYNIAVSVHSDFEAPWMFETPGSVSYCNAVA